MRTEEDIKQKIIMPFLKSLGFGEDELEFEKSFSLHLGRYAVRIDTEKEMKEAHPRLDILVKRDGRNLFVIEAKTDFKDLTDDDKEQAISYARLVHQMAPLAIVTNGKDHRIYKVDDKTEIERDKTKIVGYRIGEDIRRIYDEAFEYFIGYSFENVKIFCDAQIREGMKTLLGSKEKRDRKFIQELYVPSTKLTKVFADFLGSDKPALAIIGESGSGKTCSMCGLSLEFTQRNPILFYRAKNLTEGLVKSISNDFNWGFSAHYDEITLFKRLDKIFKGKSIVIFVDGVDEWTNPNKAEILGNFASKIRNRNFKLVISCKSGQWDKFTTRSGIPTSLSEEVFPANENMKGYLIEPFDDQEFFTMVAKYRQFYEFNGMFELDVLEECKKSPFLLRVFFEVAHKTKLPHLTFSIREFYDEYYRTVIERIPDNKDIAENTIKEIARLLFEKNLNSIDLDALRFELKLTINDAIMPSLFECNILENMSSGLESRIGFYFEKLRDYIIVFGVKKWDKIPINEFTKEWAKIDIEEVRLDAISFFYQFANLEKKKAIDAPLRANAEVYLNFYIKILVEHFPNLKSRFRPRTEKGIGFIGALDIKNKMISAYGFRALKESDENIELVPIEGGFWNKRTNIMDLMGATGLHYRGSCNGFKEFNIKKEVLELEIYEQLQKIVDNGLLNETNNYYLSLEKALGIIVSKQSQLHGIKFKSKLSHYLPIPIDRVEYGLRYERAVKYFEDKLIEERKDRGIIKPIWRGSTVSYSYSFTTEDWEFIHQQAYEAALNKRELKSNIRHIDLEQVEDILNEALSTIKQRKNIIDETIFPDQDAITIGKTGLMCDFYKRETLISCVCRIFTLFLQEYKTLIEANFPTLKNHFSLYSKMPLHYFLVVGPGEGNFSIKIFKCKSSDSKKNEVTVCENKDISFDRDKFSFAYKQKGYELFRVVSQSVTSMLSCWERFMNIEVAREFITLRNMVYQQIKDELPTALSQLSQLCQQNC
jgi:hypothetical protein